MPSNEDLSSLRTKIEDFFDKSMQAGCPMEDLAGATASVNTIIAKLDQGEVRVAHRESSGQWTTHEWIKKAILLYFRLQQMELIEVGPFSYHDKIPLKKWSPKYQVRVVPPAVVRYGAFVSPGAILMPSYVNIGSFVGAGTMVDTWATVGSCAQIGSHVHLSGGVGIGGVLEPLQSNPVIIEDDAFIGSRAIIVEGVIVEQGAVVGAGVTLTASTKILDVSGSQTLTLQGRIPRNSVVIPGVVPKKFPAGEYGVSCALVIGKRKESTDKKTALTQVLREFQVPV